MATGASASAASVYELVEFADRDGGLTGNIAAVLGKTWGVVQAQIGTGGSASILGSVDEENWHTILVTNMETGTSTSSITASGLYQVRVAGLVAVKMDEESSPNGRVVFCAIR